MANLLDDGIRAILSYLVPLVESFGVLVIMMGALRTITRYLRSSLGRTTHRITSLRNQLGQSMVMGLEFLVAADILRTALAPTWNDMLLLASLVGLRTILNYFMERELKALDADILSSDYIDPLFSAPARQRDNCRQEP